MRILGTGHDLVELARIRDALDRFGDRFLARCYTEEELFFCRRRKDMVPSLAARYAAKEAGSKALGTGIARGVTWQEIEVRRQPGERPTLHFHGRAAEIAAKMGVRVTHVSLTHERQMASAFVIVEGEDTGAGEDR